MQTTASSRRAALQGCTPDEQYNVDLVREYMEIAYAPGRASAQAVSHLCSPNNRFIAPTTFPDIHTLEEYAKDYGRLMEQVNNLHIDSFDVLFAKATASLCVIPPRVRTAEKMTSLIFACDRTGRPVVFRASSEYQLLAIRPINIYRRPDGVLRGTEDA
jgi:hypothetical protein